jgi:RES domain-containing protein
LARAIDRSTASSGNGAFRYGARWNSPGRYAVYASVNLSTAALEIFAHAAAPSAIPRDELAIRVVIPDGLAIDRVEISKLPRDWQQLDNPACQALGDAWIEQNRSAVLVVPSAVVPQDRNVVLNPWHPEFARIDVGDPGTPFRWDPRLISYLAGPVY